MLVVVCVGAAGVALVVYLIVRLTKGSIDVRLDGEGRVPELNPGDTLSGAVAVKAKRPIEGNRVLVSLVAVKVERRDNPDAAPGKNSSSYEIHREDQELGGARAFAAGTVETYPFRFELPDRKRLEALTTQDQAPKFAALLGTSGVSSVEIAFHVEARLDARGADRTTRAPFSIAGVDTVRHRASVGVGG